MTKAQAQITQVFLKLLIDAPLSKITVARICRDADLNRGTFYLHYKDVYDLYDQITQQLLNNLSDLVDQTYPKDPGPTAFMQLAQSVIDYLSSNQKTVQIILHDKNSAHFIEQIRSLFINKVMEKEHIPLSNHAYHIDVIYNINGVIGVIIDWERGQLDCSKKDVIERLAYILSLI